MKSSRSRRKPAPEGDRRTPEEQAAYDDMRAEPGILFDPEGNVIFDGEAEARGVPPFKNRAEFEAQQARLQEQLAERRRQRNLDEPKPPPGTPEGSEQRMREHWDTGFMMLIDGVVDFDSEAEKLGVPSLVGQRLPPPKRRRPRPRRA
jgi:hypothetical protein